MRKMNHAEVDEQELEQLRNKRKMLNITLTDIAQSIHYDPSHLSRLEKGVRPFGEEVFERYKSFIDSRNQRVIQECEVIPMLQKNEELRQKRTSWKISQRVLAKAIGCSSAAVSRYENGIYQLTPDLIRKYETFIASYEQKILELPHSELNLKSEDTDCDTDTSKGKEAVHPNYYASKRGEVIDFIEAYALNFNLGNVVKYVSRAGRKKGEDTLTALKKAQWYLEREISRFNPDEQIQS